MPFVYDLSKESKPNSVALRNENGSLQTTVDFTKLTEGYPSPIKLKEDITKNVLEWSGETHLFDTNSGDGSESRPYIIKTAEELANVVFDTTGATANMYFKIADGITAMDMQGMQGITLDSSVSEVKAAAIDTMWGPYNTKSSEAVERGRFSGHFDGNGCVIYNLCIEAPCAGLFPRISGSHSTGFKNIILKNCRFKCNVAEEASIGEYGVGTIIGAYSNFRPTDMPAHPKITIDNCITINCVLEGEAHQGALIGQTRYAKASINNCLLINTDFTPGHLYGAFGGVVGASQTNIFEYDSSGKIVRTYPMFTNSITVGGHNWGYYYRDAASKNDKVLGSSTGNYPNEFTNKGCVQNVYSPSVSYMATSLDESELIGVNAATNTQLNFLNDWHLALEASGSAVPVEYLEAIHSLLNHSVAQTLTRSVTTYWVEQQKTELEPNALYLVWANSGAADVNLRENLDASSNITDAAGDTIPGLVFGMIFIPKDTYKITSDGTSTLLLKRRCIVLGSTTKSLGFTNISTAIKTKQFEIDPDNKLVAYNSGSGTLSIFKVQL